MENKSKLFKAWDKIPVIIKAIILGSSISTLGVMAWTVLSVFAPMPWSVILMIALLWFYIKYFSGSWKPTRTTEFRKKNFRLSRLSKKAWFYSTIAIILIVLIEQSGLVVTFRIIKFPAERFLQEYNFLENVPAWAAWLAVIMISAVAGICEEIGFRGYMQVPLENKYGPFISISIVSIVFVIVHLHQAWSGPIMIHIFFISVLFGSIAFYSKSLIPGIIAHFFMDICNFSFWWSRLWHQFDKDPILHKGIDNHFVVWCCTFIISLVLFVFVIFRLKNTTNSSKNMEIEY